MAGLENLRGVPPGVIFALNHASELDPIVLPASLPFLSRFSPMFYTSRERTFYDTSGWRQIFYGGFFFKIWGAHPVLAGGRDYRASLASHIAIVRSGGSVCIFPEGGKTDDGAPKPAHGGVAFLAAEAGAPVVPVRADGLFKITPADFFLRRRRVTLTFGAPLRFHHPAAAAADPALYRKYAEQVMAAVRGL